MATTAPVAAPMANDSAVPAPAARAMPPAMRPADVPKTPAFSPGVISAQPTAKMEMEVARATGLINPSFIEEKMGAFFRRLTTGWQRNSLGEQTRIPRSENEAEARLRPSLRVG